MLLTKLISSACIFKHSHYDVNILRSLDPKTSQVLKLSISIYCIQNAYFLPISFWGVFLPQFIIFIFILLSNLTLVTLAVKQWSPNPIVQEYYVLSSLLFLF